MKKPEKLENNKIPEQDNNQNYINLNNTKFLIDDSMGISTNSLFMSNYSNIKNANLQAKLNSTQNLLSDKTSNFSQNKSNILINTDKTKFMEKYKDLLPEINLELSSNNPSQQDYIVQKKYISDINTKFEGNQKINFNKTRNNNELFNMDYIKEENENTDTINLAENLNSNNYTPINTDLGDERKNTNLYCLTNSNIENKFYSSILETNDFFKNKPERDDECIEENLSIKKYSEENNKKINSNQRENYDEENLSGKKNEINYEKENNKKYHDNNNDYDNLQNNENGKIRNIPFNNFSDFNNNYNNIDYKNSNKNINKNNSYNNIDYGYNNLQNKTQSHRDQKNTLIDEKDDIDSIDNISNYHNDSKLNQLNSDNNKNKFSTYSDKALNFKAISDEIIKIPCTNNNINKIQIDSMEKTNFNNSQVKTNNIFNPNNFKLNNQKFNEKNQSCDNESNQYRLDDQNTFRNMSKESKENFMKNQFNKPIEYSNRNIFEDENKYNNFHDNNFNIVNKNTENLKNYNLNRKNNFENMKIDENNFEYCENLDSEKLEFSNILDVIEIDKEFINYPLSFPGEILTAEISFSNITKIDFYLDINFSKIENLLKIFKRYYQSDIKEIFEEIPNSQNKYQCFSMNYFEVNNNLVEKENLRIFLQKKTKAKILIILKTPQIKKKYSLFTSLEISMLSNFNNPIEKNIENKNFTYQIPIMASVEIPKLLCLKELYSEKAKFPFISLLLEVKTKGQKFKIPFKNFSLKEIELELIFEKIPINYTIFTHKDKYYECQFLCFPSKLTIPSHGVCNVDLIAKIKKIKNNENIDFSKIGNKIRKVLIGKIKNASVYYSFFIEASFSK